MVRFLRQCPALVLLALMASVLMLVPTLHALAVQDHATARAFFYFGALFAALSVMLGIALSGRRRPSPSGRLLELLVAYAVLPLLLAAPVNAVIGPIGFGQAYFEMLSCLTTTGATLIPAGAPDSVHLWRGLVGWAGGFLILVIAVAVLEPLQLGGFEIQAAMSRGSSSLQRRRGARAAEQLGGWARAIAPAYGVLTLILAIGLMLAGEAGLVATVHAMSVMSTSGITPLAGFEEARAGLAGEALVLVFLALAISRRPLTLFQGQEGGQARTPDVELRMAVALTLAVAGLLFLRHFLGAYDVQDQANLSAALTAAWGSVFNVLSFLSTTGFESRDWDAARAWSGLETPGLILLGLCLLGGGIASTAGGVKLLRVYALYRHGQREMQRLVHPSSVGGAGMTARRIRREGAQLAWVFLMLFLAGIAALLLVLTALGQPFATALALGIAALTNTGPAAALLEPGFGYATLDGWERAALCFGMIVGRFEALVFVSLLNPDYWRQ